MRPESVTAGRSASRSGDACRRAGQPVMRLVSRAVTSRWLYAPAHQARVAMIGGMTGRIRRIARGVGRRADEVMDRAVTVAAPAAAMVMIVHTVIPGGVRQEIGYLVSLTVAGLAAARKKGGVFPGLTWLARA